MNPRIPATGTILKAGLAVAALAAMTGLAFAGWMEHAPGIFMAMVESGMAWCF
ncbi:hypothetical protein [Mesorhizobium sp. CAU 1732]|uniref:hypothetical protein n=1 Tax=Mesorhizobium sp. CAU 1732 TaxID=3140358 RepID=UPI0032618B02